MTTPIYASHRKVTLSSLTVNVERLDPYVPQQITLADLSLLKLYLSYVYEYFPHIFGYALHVLLIPRRSVGDIGFPWNLNYRWSVASH